jgi:RecB family exonuclease
MDIAQSKSSISVFNQCEFKYQKKYIEKDPGIKKYESLAMSLFGNVVHDAFERYFHPENKESIISIYKKEFDKSDLRDRSLFDLGEFAIQDYANRSVGVNVIALEKDFDMYLDNGVRVRGFIDRIDELAPDECEIIDYKTGFSQPLSKSSLDTDLQLGIYNLAVNILYPQYKKVKLSLNYMQHGKISTTRTPESLEALKDYLEVVNSKIIRLYKTKDAKPMLNDYCPHCEYKNKCGVYSSVVFGDEVSKSLATVDGYLAPDKGIIIKHDDVAKFLDEVRRKQSILKKIEDDLKAYLKKRIEESGGKDIAVGERRFSLTQRRMTVYDANTVASIMLEKGLDLNSFLEPRKTNIDSALKGDKISIEKLEKTSKLEYTNGYVK